MHPAIVQEFEMPGLTIANNKSRLQKVNVPRTAGVFPFGETFADEVGAPRAGGVTGPV